MDWKNQSEGEQIRLDKIIIFCIRVCAIEMIIKTNEVNMPQSLNPLNLVKTDLSMNR